MVNIIGFVFRLYSALLFKASNSPLGLRKIHCHWNTFEISWIKLLKRTLIPLLFKWSLDLFKVVVDTLLMISIMNIKFLKELFKITIYFLTFCWCLYFLIKIFEIITSHLVVFDDIARSKIGFAMVSGVLFEEIWKTILSALSLKTGFTWSVIYRNRPQACGLQLYQKRDSGTYVFLWVLRNF